MTYDGRAIANFVLDQADSLAVAVSPLALQKIVYFCHVWSLIELGRPLVKQSFEAWEHGPVLQYLYREFKSFGSHPVTGRARQFNSKSGKLDVVGYQFDEATRELLVRVVGFYSRLSAGALVDLTHATGGPWHAVWFHAGKVNPGMRIDNAEIVRFYSKVPTPATVQ